MDHLSSKHMRDFLLEVGTLYNTIPLRSIKRKSLVLNICLIIQSIQFLALVLPSEYALTVNAVLPMKFMIWISSVRTWISAASFKIVLIAVMLLLICLIMVILTIHGIFRMVKAKKVPLLYSLMIETRIPFVYSNVLLIPSLETGVLLLLKNDTYVKSTCTDTSCQIGMRTLGGVIIVFALSLHMFYEWISVNMSYQSQSIIQRISSLRNTIRVTYSLVIGLISVCYNDVYVSIICCIVWASLYAAELCYLLYKPEFSQNMANRTSVVLKLLAIGMAVDNILEYYGYRRAAIIIPLIVSLMIKAALNIQEHILWHSFQFLKSEKSTLRNMDTHLQILYSTFIMSEKVDYRFLEMMKPIISAQESIKLQPAASPRVATSPRVKTMSTSQLKSIYEDSEILNKEKEVFEKIDYLHPDEFYYFQKIRRSLIEMVRSTYHRNFEAFKGRIPATFLCSYVEFLTEVCEDYTQSLFAIAHARKYSKYDLTFRQELRLKILQARMKSSLKEQNQLVLQDIEDICKHLDKFEMLVRATDQFIVDKAAFHAKFLEPAIDLRSIKAHSHTLLKNSTKLAKKMEHLILKQKNHIGIQILYEFLVKYIQEDVNRYQKMKHNLIVRHMIAPEMDAGKDSLLTDDNLLNSDLTTKVGYLVVSLEQQSCGKLVAWSPNFPEVISSTSAHLRTMSLRDIIAPFQNHHFNSLFREIQASSDLTEIYQRKVSIFFRAKNEGLCHYFAQFEVQTYKGEPTLVIYLRNNLDFEQQFLLFEETGSVIGLSKALMSTLCAHWDIKTAHELEHSRVTMSKLFPYVNIEQLLFDGTRMRTVMKPPQIATRSNVLSSKPPNLMTEFDSEDLRESDSGLRIIKLNIWKIKPMDSSSGPDTFFETVQREAVQMIKKIKNGKQFRIVVNSSIAEGEAEMESVDNSYAMRNAILSENFDEKELEEARHLDEIPNITKRTTMLLPFSTRPLMTDLVNQESPSPISFKFTGFEGNNEPEVVRSDRASMSDSNTHKKDWAKDKRKVHKREASIYASNTTADTKRKQASKILIVVYRLKELVNQGSTPLFLKQTNYFGLISFVVIAIAIAIFYAILNRQYYYYAQYAKTAYFPSYFSSVVKSLMAVTECAVSVNVGLMTTPSRAAIFVSNPRNVYKNRVQRFKTYYNKYMVQYDISQVLPDITSSRYSLELQRSSFDIGMKNYSFQESMTVLLGLTYKLNYTAFVNYEQLDNDNWDVIFLRMFSWNYIQLYERMRLDLFSAFYNQKDMIWTTLKVMIYVLIFLAILTFSMFGFIVMKIYWHEIRILSKLCTIPDDQTAALLKKLQAKYKDYFKKDLSIPVLDKGEFKKGGGNNVKVKMTKQFVNQSHNSIYYLAYFAVISILLGAYAIVTSLLAYNKVEQTVTFIKDLEIMSGVHLYVGASTATNLMQMNTQELMPQLSFRYDIFRNATYQLVNLLQDVQSRIFDNPLASPLLIERYRNLTNSNFCYDSITSPNYKNCMTSLNGASSLGFASLYNAEYVGLIAQRDAFLNNLTVENSQVLIDSDNFVQIDTNGPCIDATFVANIETEGTFLYNLCVSIQDSMIWVLISGLLLTLGQAVLIWRPMYLKMKKQFMEVRQIFSQLPVELIMHNNYIKNILKQGGESSI